MSATNPGEGPTAAPLPSTTPSSGPADKDLHTVLTTPRPSEIEEGQNAKAPPKFFTLSAAPATVPPIRVHMPGLLPEHEPFVFILRITFSEHMQKKRDAFLMLAPVKQVEVEDEEILNEVCDLLAQDPTGFGDYSPVTAEVGLGSPGNKFRAYYKAAEKASPQAFAIVKLIARAANNIYWANVTPREFFPPSTDNGAGESKARQTDS